MVVLKNSEGFSLNIFTLVIAVFLSLFSFMVLDNLKTGIGFGKDIRVVVKTEQVQQLDQFIKDTYQSGNEIRKENIADNIFLLTSSYGAQLSTFENELRAQVNQVEIMHSGSFGSITKLKNYHSFVAVYLFVFISLLFLYFTYRFKILGIYASFEIIFLIMASLGSVVYFDYPFTKSLWYALMMGTIVLISQQWSYLIKHEGKTLESVYDTQGFFSPIGILHSVIFLLMGMVTLHQAPYNFPSVSIFFFALSALNLVTELFNSRLMPYIVLQLADEDHREEIVFTRRNFVNIEEHEERGYLITTRVFTGLFVVSIIVGLFTGFQYQEGEDFSNLNVIVVKQSDPATYLQVEALMHRTNYFDQQVNYEVSEQDSIWIKMSQNLNMEELAYLSEVISTDTRIETGYFKTNSAKHPLLDRVYYMRGAGMIVCAIFLQFLFRRTEHLLQYISVTVLSGVFFVLLVIVYQLNWTREIVVASWFVPLITSVLSTSERGLLTDTHHTATFSASLHTLAIIILISVPVFIIVPTRIGIEMAFVLTLMLIAIHFAFCFVVSSREDKD